MSDLLKFSFNDNPVIFFLIKFLKNNEKPQNQI